MRGGSVCLNPASELSVRPRESSLMAACKSPVISAVLAYVLLLYVHSTDTSYLASCLGSRLNCAKLQHVVIGTIAYYIAYHAAPSCRQKCCVYYLISFKFSKNFFASGGAAQGLRPRWPAHSWHAFPDIACRSTLLLPFRLRGATGEPFSL